MPVDPAPLCAWPWRSLPRRTSLLATCCLLLASHAWAGLDVNTASEADLDSLRGVGPSLSARILSQRALQPFAHWADLMQRVKGLRAATAHRLSAQGLTVNGVAYTEAPPSDALPSAPDTPSPDTATDSAR